MRVCPLPVTILRNLQKTGKCLLDKGAQTFAQVVGATDLQFSDVRSSMVVLMQHNYVDCFRVQEEGGVKGPPKQHYVYEALLDKMLQNIR